MRNLELIGRSELHLFVHLIISSSNELIEDVIVAFTLGLKLQYCKYTVEKREKVREDKIENRKERG